MIKKEYITLERALDVAYGIDEKLDANTFVIDFTYVAFEVSQQKDCYQIDIFPADQDYGDWTAKAYSINELYERINRLRDYHKFEPQSV